MAKAVDVQAHRAAHELDVEKLWPLQVVALMVAYRRAIGRDATSPDELRRWAQELEAKGQAFALMKVFDNLSLDEQAYVREQLSRRCFEQAGQQRPGTFTRVAAALRRSIRQ